MPKDTELTQYYLEAKYRFIIKIGLLVVLVLLTLIDAMFTQFEVPVEVDLAIIAAVAGIETREQIKRRKHVEYMQKRYSIKRKAKK